MRPSLIKLVRPASQASVQKQCLSLCAGNAEFLANDIRCKKGLDGLGCLGEPAAWGAWVRCLGALQPAVPR